MGEPPGEGISASSQQPRGNSVEADVLVFVPLDSSASFVYHRLLISSIWSTGLQAGFMGHLYWLCNELYQSQLRFEYTDLHCVTHLLTHDQLMTVRNLSLSLLLRTKNSGPREMQGNIGGVLLGESYSYQSAYQLLGSTSLSCMELRLRSTLVNKCPLPLLPGLLVVGSLLFVGISLCTSSHTHTKLSPVRNHTVGTVFPPTPPNSEPPAPVVPAELAVLAVVNIAEIPHAHTISRYGLRPM